MAGALALENMFVTYFFRLLQEAAGLYLTGCAFLLQMVFGCEGGMTAALVFQILPLIVMLFSLNLDIWKIGVIDFSVLGGGVYLLAFCPAQIAVGDFLPYLEDLSLLSEHFRDRLLPAVPA